MGDGEMFPFTILVLANLEQIGFGLGGGFCRSIFNANVKKGKRHKLQTYIIVHISVIDQNVDFPKIEMSSIL